MSQIKKSLGQYLKKHRLEKNLSQAELASKLGYETSQYISDWERGVFSPPMKKLRQISDILDLDMDHLFKLMIEFSKQKMIADMENEYSKIKKRSKSRS